MVASADGNNAQIKAAQGNERGNAPHHSGRIPQAPNQRNYDARCTARPKIALNCWFSENLRFYRKVYSSRCVCKYLAETE